MTDSQQFVIELVEQITELKPLLLDHIQDNHEILPHVFMGDVTRFVLTLGEKLDERGADAITSRALLLRIFARLELALESRLQEIEVLVAASFVENLLGEKKSVRTLEPLAGPKLRSRLRAVS